MKRLPDPPAGQLSLPPVDIELRDVGSLVIIDPLTDSALAWCEDNIDSEALRWGRGFVCEWRYVEAIVLGLQHDGFRVSPFLA